MCRVEPSKTPPLLPSSLPSSSSSSSKPLKIWEMQDDQKEEARIFIDENTTFRNEHEWHPQQQRGKPYQCNSGGIRTLRGSEWLNDEVINAYLHAIKRDQPYDDHSLLVFSTHLHICLEHNIEVVGEFTSHLTLNDLNRDMIIPVYRPSHWILVILSPRTETIYIYDSYRQPHNNVKERLLNWYEDVRAEKSNGLRISTRSWTCVAGDRIPNHKLARQYDGTSCGVFVCITAAYLIQHKRIPTPKEFCQNDVPNCRLYIAAVLRHAGTYEQTQEAFHDFRLRDDEAAMHALASIDLVELYSLRDQIDLT